jgi:hypothetical protein
VNTNHTQSASVPADFLFTPEVILPSQFFAATTVEVERPERRLMLAVLQDAVATLLKHAGSTRSGPRRLVREAEQWITARNHDWPFSFENICNTLNLDPAALRAGLRAIAHGGAPRVVSLPIGRRVVGERHRVSVPRPHHRAAATANAAT